MKMMCEIKYLVGEGTLRDHMSLGHRRLRYYALA